MAHSLFFPTLKCTKKQEQWIIVIGRFGIPKKKLTPVFCSLVPFFEPVRHSERPNTFRKVQEIYWDQKLKGFGFCVGARTKSYIAQIDIKGRTHRKTIGKYPHLTIEQARNIAKIFINNILSENCNVERKKRQIASSLTLAAAAGLKRSCLIKEKKSTRTISDHDYTFRKYFIKWAKKDMKEIGEDKNALRQFHEKLTREHGPISANHTVGWLRGVYNLSRKEHAALPPNPTEEINWNPTKRNASSISMKELSKIWTGIQKLGSLKRDFYILLLFSGLRRKLGCVIRWEHYNEEDALLTIPCPAGKKKKATCIPLTEPLQKVFRSRQKENKIHASSGCPWVFPSVMSSSGHIVDPKLTASEMKLFPSKLTASMLHHTYSVVGNALGVNNYNLALLLNHSIHLKNDTDVYAYTGMESLRADQEAITNYLLFQINT